MTVVAAIAEKGRLYFAADRAGSYLGTTVKVGAPKIAKRGSLILGCSGATRVANLVTHLLKPPRLKVRRALDLDRYMIAFGELAFAYTKEHGALSRDADEGRDVTGGAWLAGARGRLFLFDAACGCTPIDGDFFAIGSGADLALGSLATTADDARYTPRTRLEVALDIASRYCDTVAPPFDFLDL